MPLLERSKLYKDVWSRPCTKIAAELGISSSALKRICMEMDIPTPVVGYWTRVQCGKKVAKDGKIQRIESCLDQIVATFPLAGEFLQRERLRRAEDERRRKELEELRYRMDAIQRKEDEAVEILLNHSENHRRANELRDFIEVARSRDRGISVIMAGLRRRTHRQIFGSDGRSTMPKIWIR